LDKVVKVAVLIVIIVGIAVVWAIKNPFVVSDEEVLQLNLLELSEESNELLAQPEENLEKVETEYKEQEYVANIELLPNEKPQEDVIVKEESTKKEEVIVVKEPEKVEEIKTEISEPKNVMPEVYTVIENEVPTVEEVVTDVTTPELVATEFDIEKLKAYKLPIMIEFGASWCTWCRWMEPTLEELNKEYAGKVIVQSVDVEKFYNEVSGFDVSLLPTIYFFDADGNVFETRVGAMVKEDIVKVFESMGVTK